jgi:hypothetical protein
VNSKQKSVNRSTTTRQILIAPDLFFLVPDARSAILVFLVTHGTLRETFAVNLLKKSMKACRNAIQADEIHWQMADRSLIVTGTKDAVLLTFRRGQTNLGSEAIRLSGTTLRAFRDTLEELSK